LHTKHHQFNITINSSLVIAYVQSIGFVTTSTVAHHHYFISKTAEYSTSVVLQWKDRTNNAIRWFTNRKQHGLTQCKFTRTMEGSLMIRCDSDGGGLSMAVCEFWRILLLE
jgi:hypothetical protein